MPHKFALVALQALALGLLAVTPCAAMSTTTAPLNSNGTPRFTDPNAAPQTFSSGPGQTTTSFGNGSFTFGVTTSNGDATGFANPGFYGPGPTSPYYTGPSSSGSPDQTFPNQAPPNSQIYPGSPFLFNPAPGVPNRLR
jgi:hypothetical protein